MIIGFNQRSQTIPENFRGEIVTEFTLFITVSTQRTSERSHTIVFRYLEGSSTATVVPLAEEGAVDFDARFGSRNESDDPITVRHILQVGESTIVPLQTSIQNDLNPEKLECYTISIFKTDEIGVRDLFECNEDDSNPTEFFCDHTICIENDDG